ncbi:Uncharacterised protein [Mycobacterium tuberculosis]|nr:Uncharacterised protein [Mycobacterium tuberculosis]
MGLSTLVTSMSSWACSGWTESSRSAARSRSSTGSLNCSDGMAPWQMMFLPSASSPTTLSSRMASPRRLRAGQRRTCYVRTLVR